MLATRAATLRPGGTGKSLILLVVLLAALVMSALGPGGLYLFSGAVHLSLFGYVGIRTLKRVPVQTELRSDFGEALASAQTASDVYETDDDDEGLPDTA